MPLTENGYHRPTYDEILEAKIQTAKEFFGEDIETSEQTPFGKFIRIGAKDLAKAYEDVEAIYYARFPNTSSGVSLDRLCPFVGITRNPATYAEHNVLITGDAGTEVEEIIVCGKDSEVTFHNIESFIIPESGSISIVVQCETAGKVGNVSVIDEIVNPIAGVNTVEYTGTVKHGEDNESDYNLRKRFYSTSEGAGSTNANSIRAAILRVPTVKSASVISNDTNEIVDGRPPHTFECFVYGGEEYQQEIAQAIYNKKAIGIQTCSTSDNPVEIEIVDDGGTKHPITFSICENVPIYITVKYKKNNKFSTDGEVQIKNALIEHINNLGVGADVVISSLYGYIYSIEGVIDVTDLTIGTTAEAQAMANIGVEKWQVPMTDTAKITLTEVVG